MPKDLRAVANRGARLMALSLALVLVFDSGCARRQRGPSEHELISEALSVYETGFEMEREGDDPRARDAYERSLAISPRPIAHYRLGVVLGRIGEYDEALNHLDRALQLAPSLSVAEREKVRVNAQRAMTGDVESRPPVRRKESPVISESPLPEEREVLPAEPPSAPKKPAEAEKEQVVVARPTDIDKEEVSEPPEQPVPEVAPPSVETRETSPEVELAMARAFSAARRGDLEGAVQIYRETLRVAPNDPRLHYNLGNVFQRQEKFQQAYLKYQHALDQDPDYGRAWNNLGYVLERLSRSDEAIDCYQQAVLTGQVPEAYFNSGLLLEKKGQLEPALQRFREFLDHGGSGELAEEAKQHIKRLERHF